ncbi:MAG TPA: GDP-mannose 4,6-dehydratase [Candidatus Paceibacterota bacterium]
MIPRQAHGKRILITGGAGFIGISCARYFIERDYKVTLLDNFSRKGSEINVHHLAREYPGKFVVIRADITHDLEQLRDAVALADIVLHLAAQVAVTTSVISPRGDFMRNAMGTVNVLEAVRVCGHKPIVLYSSTNKVYGALSHHEITESESRYAFAGKPHGIDESEGLDFHSPYGCSKGAADQYMRDYGRIYDIPTVVFRQSCIYGPRQFGVEDQGWVAWFAIATLLDRPVTIYGTGKQVRDLLHVSDLARLYELAINNINKSRGQVYNVGGGPNNTLSLLELLPKLETLTGKNLKFLFSETRPGDQPIFVADIRKAKNELGWQPQIGVDEGIKDIVTWIQTHQTALHDFFSH